MKRVDLEELERLDKEATPGPWKNVLTQRGVRHIEPLEYSDEIASLFGGGDDGDVENSSLIVAIRNALPAIIAELRAGREVARVASGVSVDCELFGYAADLRKALTAYDEATKGEG